MVERRSVVELLLVVELAETPVVELPSADERRSAVELAETPRPTPDSTSSSCSLSSC